MKFKKPELQNELHQRSTMLQVVVEWFDQLCQVHFKKEATVVRVLESISGATQVHPQGRAVDIRNEHAGTFEFTPEQAQFLTSEMNRRFPRRDGKVTCYYHSFNGAPFHFHLQIPADPSNMLAAVNPLKADEKAKS